MSEMTAPQRRAQERINRSSRPFEDIPHGTANGYNNYICRCAKCRAAKADEGRALREQRASGNPENLPHGTKNGYAQWGCRCDACKTAHTQSKTHRRISNNGATQQSATNAGGRWTGPELEIATREDLTAREAAALLGRSYFAIEAARLKCLHDPRYIDLLGATKGADL